MIVLVSLAVGVVGETVRVTESVTVTVCVSLAVGSVGETVRLTESVTVLVSLAVGTVPETV